MRMVSFPLYCGGRLLLGLYNGVSRTETRVREDGRGYEYIIVPRDTDEEVYEKNKKKQLRNHSSTDPTADKTSACSDIYPYICTDVKLNQKLLIECVAIPHKYKDVIWNADRTEVTIIEPVYAFQSIGTIVAVTNRSETNAEEFLEATGFKVAAATNKMGNDVGNLCKTWIGDFHKDIRPILAKFAVEHFEPDKFEL